MKSQLAKPISFFTKLNTLTSIPIWPIDRGFKGVTSKPSLKLMTFIEGFSEYLLNTICSYYRGPSSTVESYKLLLFLPVDFFWLFSF